MIKQTQKSKARAIKRQRSLHIQSQRMFYSRTRAQVHKARSYWVKTLEEQDH